MKKLSAVFLACLLCLAGCSIGQQNISNGSGGGTTTPATLSICQSIVVPAYFETQSVWDAAVADSPWDVKVSRTIILNPNSGPGTAADPVFQGLVTTVHNAGGKIYGYVYTNYGALDMATAEAQIQQYISWYNVDGIFLDGTSDEASEVAPYYQPLVTYVTSNIAGGGVIMNPGTYPDPSYATITVPSSSLLRIVVFEHDYATFAEATSIEPGWADDYPSSLFINIVYDTPAADVSNALILSAERNVGAIYLTDQILPNPYTTLPSYWTMLTQATQAGCQ